MFGKSSIRSPPTAAVAKGRGEKWQQFTSDPAGHTTVVVSFVELKEMLRMVSGQRRIEPSLANRNMGELILRTGVKSNRAKAPDIGPPPLNIRDDHEIS